MMFAEFQKQAFVSHILKDFHLFCHFFESQFISGQGIASMKSAIIAVVYAIAGNIEGSENTIRSP